MLRILLLRFTFWKRFTSRCLAVFGRPVGRRLNLMMWATCWKTNCHGGASCLNGTPLPFEILPPVLTVSFWTNCRGMSCVVQFFFYDRSDYIQVTSLLTRPAFCGDAPHLQECTAASAAAWELAFFFCGRVTGVLQKGSETYRSRYNMLQLRCTLWGSASLLSVLTVPAAPWEYESTSQTMKRRGWEDWERQASIVVLCRNSA